MTDDLEDQVRVARDVRHLQLVSDNLTESVRDEHVAHEEPLEIQVNGASVAVVMRTPGHDEELGLGFLITEKVIGSEHDIDSIRHCTTAPDPESEGNVLQVRLRADVSLDLERLRRHMFASSSCGVCGKATIAQACPQVATVVSDVRVSARTLTAQPDALRGRQTAFGLTGGLHAAGLFDLATGAMVAVREDVGRHNAVDKVIGFARTHALALERHGLILSGRIAFELVQKAAVVRVPIVAGISAPTSLAIRMGQAAGITVVGFLRGGAMNAYAHAQRIVE